MVSENKKYQSCQYRTCQRQHGFVLILVLVLMTVMTLIGISSMNSANLELRAAANAKQHHVAFNAVQSVIEFAVSSDGANLIDFQTSSVAQQVITHTVNDTSALSASAVYAGCTVGVGSSLEAGKGMRYNFFNITGSGANKIGTATSTQVQGVRFPAAACD